MMVPCQTKCSSAHPTACAAGWWSNASIPVMVGLLLLTGAVDGASDFTQLVGRRVARGERLHDELGRGPAERAIHEIADELTLRLLLAQPRTIDVRAVPLVAFDESFFRHDLQQFQGGRIRGRTLASQDVVYLPDSAGAAIPQHAQDRQFGVCGPGNGGSRGCCHWTRSIYEQLRSCQRRTS